MDKSHNGLKHSNFKTLCLEHRSFLCQLGLTHRLKIFWSPVMVAYTFNTSTWEAEEGGTL